MRILLISDQHNSEEGLEWALELIESREPDLIIHLGDIISARPASFIRETLRKLVGTGRPVLVVPGNNDPRESLSDFADSGAVNLHESVHKEGGIRFIGRGGSNPTPFNTVFEDDDELLGATLGVNAEPGDVWCVHAPVFGFRDRMLPDGHTGVKSYRNLINQVKPWVVLSGHIHDDWGLDVYKGTHFINPGALQDLRAAIVDLDRPKVEVSFLGK